MRLGWVAISFTLALLLAASPSRAWADTVTLEWDPSPDPSVIGYMLYVGTEPGTYTSQYNVGNVSSFVFGDGVPPGTRYYFAVAAYAPDELFSSMTNEVSWANDAPPDLISGVDVTAPVVTVIAPTLLSRFNLSSSFVELAGTVIDEGGIRVVSWVNDKTGQSGTAVGTASWTTEVPIAPGRNDITVFAVDETGNIGVASISVFQSGQ